MAVKRRLKIKKKNFAIFLLCNFVIIFLIIFIIHFVIKGINSLTSKEKMQESSRVVEQKNKNTKKKVQPRDLEKDDNKEKLKQLGNINKKIDFFKMEYLDRYIDYKSKNEDLEDEQIVLNVNMGIDKPYYTNTSETKYLNTTYILVNKYNFLSSDYVPKNLVSISNKYSIGGMKLVEEARDAFEDMASDALKEKMHIIAMSSYRSYNYQVDLYNKYAKQDGKDAADTYSARAGFSEHQSGLCLDVYDGEIPYTSFEKTNEFKWMQKNAYKYGFILRFPKDKVDETGYRYESWHYRYVGKEIAKYIYDNNISFEEYYARFIEEKK